MTELDFGFKRNAQMLANLSHNVGKTIISEFAVKVEYFCCMIIGSQPFNKPCM